jgi:hypothetical protein
VASGGCCWGKYVICFAHLMMGVDNAGKNQVTGGVGDNGEKGDGLIASDRLTAYLRKNF